MSKRKEAAISTFVSTPTRFSARIRAAASLSSSSISAPSVKTSKVRKSSKTTSTKKSSKSVVDKTSPSESPEDTSELDESSEASVLSEDVINFGKAYAWALYCGAYYWNFHDDSGCFWDTCQDQSQTYGNWTALYKPGKGMKECDGESWTYTVLFLHKPAISDQLYEDIQPMIWHVEDLYLQSYNDLRRVTKGKWPDRIEEGTVEEIAKIVSPMLFERGVLRMSFEIRGIREVGEFKSNDSWMPRRLAKWLGFYQGDDLEYQDVMDRAGNYLPTVRLDNEVPEDYYWFDQDAVEAVV